MLSSAGASSLSLTFSMRVLERNTGRKMKLNTRKSKIMRKTNCKELTMLISTVLKGNTQTETKDFLRLGSSKLDEIYGAVRGCRAITMEDIGED